MRAGKQNVFLFNEEEPSYHDAGKIVDLIFVTLYHDNWQ